MTLFYMGVYMEKESNSTSTTSTTSKNKLVNRTRLSSPVRNDLYIWLKDYSEQTGIPLSRLLDKCIESYMKELYGSEFLNNWKK